MTIGFGRLLGDSFWTSPSRSWCSSGRSGPRWTTTNGYGGRVANDHPILARYTRPARADAPMAAAGADLRGAGSELCRHEAAKDTRAQLLLRDAGVADLGRQLRLERGPGRDPPCDLGFIELSRHKPLEVE